MHEVEVKDGPGKLRYALLRRAGQTWNGSTWVDDIVMDPVACGLPATEVAMVAGPGGWSIYWWDFPAAIILAGLYRMDVFVQKGATRAKTDGPPDWEFEIDWTGSAEDSAATHAAPGTPSASAPVTTRMTEVQTTFTESSQPIVTGSYSR